MSRKHFHNVFENAFSVSSGRTQGKDFTKSLFIQFCSDSWIGKQTFDFRSIHQGFSFSCVKKRFCSHSVPKQKQSFLPGIPQSCCKASIKSGNKLFSKMQIRLNHDLPVLSSFKNRSHGFQFFAKLWCIVKTSIHSQNTGTDVFISCHATVFFQADVRLSRFSSFLHLIHGFQYSAPLFLFLVIDSLMAAKSCNSVHNILLFTE